MINVPILYHWFIYKDRDAFHRVSSSKLFLHIYLQHSWANIKALSAVHRATQRKMWEPGVLGKDPPGGEFVGTALWFSGFLGTVLKNQRMYSSYGWFKQVLQKKKIKFSIKHKLFVCFSLDLFTWWILWSFI